MSPPSLLIGWVPKDARAGLIGHDGIRQITERAVDPGTMRLESTESASMVNFFNAAVRGELEVDTPDFNSAPLQDASHRAGDLREPPPFDEASYFENLRSVGLTKEDLLRQGVPVGSSSQLTAGNSDVMSGTVALSVFFMESDGTGADRQVCADIKARYEAGEITREEAGAELKEAGCRRPHRGDAASCDDIKARLDDAVASGRISQEDADARLQGAGC